MAVLRFGAHRFCRFLNRLEVRTTKPTANQPLSLLAPAGICGR
jgi:hypothetical protein